MKSTCSCHVRLIWKYQIHTKYQFESIWVESKIIWVRPWEVVNESTWVPSDVQRSFFHQFVDLTLKSPLISKNKGFLAITSPINCSKFINKMSNWSCVWLGDLESEPTHIFLFLMDTSNITHSLGFLNSIEGTAKNSL